ncbi:hypothetical protein [Sorangium sp. So ce233]|uniref:hypothetical protein n=1 Tax=Sorangium sp. So ce233 TaxID=3133290 RepID=UPI003F633186
MTPSAVRDRAAALLVAAADRADACCARALLAVADDVRAIRLPEAPPPPAEATRRRDVIVRSLERYARLLQRGHEVQSVVVALRGIARQVRRLVLAPEPPPAPEAPRARATGAAPPSRPEGRYTLLDAETALLADGERRRPRGRS